MGSDLNLPALRAVIGAMRIAAQAGETEEQVIVRYTDLTTLADACERLVGEVERMTEEFKVRDTEAVQDGNRIAALAAENERLRAIITEGLDYLAAFEHGDLRGEWSVMQGILRRMDEPITPAPAGKGEG